MGFDDILQTFLFSSSDEYKPIDTVNMNAGLELLVHPESWNYKSFTEPIYGFYLFIHHPEDFIDFPTEWSTFQPSYHIKILILPDTLRSDENIRSLQYKQRQCIFQNENFLEFSNEYSYWSCLAECRMREILKICNCIPFYYPHISKSKWKAFELIFVHNWVLVDMKKYSNYLQCNFRHVSCLRQNMIIINSIQPPMGTDGFNGNKTVGVHCDCLPNCHETVSRLMRKFSFSLINVLSLEVSFRNCDIKP